MIGLMTLTLREPRRAFARLRGLELPLSARWGLVVMAAAASAVLSFLGTLLIPVPADAPADVLHVLSVTPWAMAATQVASAALAAYLLAEVGRVFRGTGGFADALLAVGWIETMMVAFQALQLATMLVLPPLAGLIGIGSLVLATVLVILFTMELHGFRNPLLVVLGIMGTVMVTGFMLSILAATLGLLPEVPV